MMQELERDKLKAVDQITQQQTEFAACKMELEQKVNQLQSEVTLHKTRLRELGKLLTHCSINHCHRAQDATILVPMESPCATSCY